MMNKVCGFILLLATAVTAWTAPVQDAALMEAASQLDVAGVRQALRQGANPNVLSDTARKTSPLEQIALGVLMHKKEHDAEERAIAIANSLFESGARLGPHDQGVLFFPISAGFVRFVSLLLDKGASPTARVEGYTPTELAVAHGQVLVYELLVARGGIPVRKYVAAQLSLNEAAQNGDIDGMSRALVAGAEIDGEDATGKTALITALRTPIYKKENADTIRWILVKGANPNKKGESGFRDVDQTTPLHMFVLASSYALKDNRPEVRQLAEEIMRDLLKAGAKVSGMDVRDRTPLHFAARSDNLRAAEILIGEGARVMARDTTQKTPLDYAESKAMILLLKQNGATER